MSSSEIAAKLAEIKRLSNVVTGIAPAKKSQTVFLSEKDRELIKELTGRIATLANEVLRQVSLVPEPIDSKMEEDIVTALLNLGCKRQEAETAVGRAKADLGASHNFSDLFRKALDMLR